MSEAGSYDAGSAHRDFDHEVERLRAQALLSWEREARTLDRFGLRDGLSVLELGSGPGFITEQLLAWLPNSEVTSLEIDRTLMERAKAYLRGKGDHRVQFVEASILDTGLPSDHFDFALARLIFQHLPDPVAAAAEVRRVLKPGGTLAIVDSDDAIWGLTDPVIPEIGLALERMGQVQKASGGDRLVGRKLWRILEAAGFVGLDLEAVAFHSDALGIEAFDPQFDPDRLLPLIEIGLWSEGALGQFRASREAFDAAERPYILMLLLIGCGRKP